MVGKEKDTDSSDGEDIQNATVNKEDGNVSSMSEAKSMPVETTDCLSEMKNSSENPRKRGRRSKEKLSSKKSFNTERRNLVRTGGRKQRGLGLQEIAMQLNGTEESEEELGEDCSEKEESSPVKKKRKHEEVRRSSQRERKTSSRLGRVEIEDYRLGSSSSDDRKPPKKKQYSKQESEYEDDSNVECDTKQEKKQGKSKTVKKFVIKKKLNMRKVEKKEAASSDDNKDSSDNEEAELARRFKLKSKGTDIAKKTSTRQTAKKMYAEESDTSDLLSDYNPKEVAVEEEMEGIEGVLDHRTGKVGATGEATMYWATKREGDPNDSLVTEEREEQFLIKWSGRSHLNNTWESESSLEARGVGGREVRGLRRLVNYQMKLSEYNAWKRRAQAEDVEFREMDIELGRQLVATYLEVERIFAQRGTDTGDGLEYYVKWTNLPYSEASWEEEAMLRSCYGEHLDIFTSRKEADTSPRDYITSMKNSKKKFVPLKVQPDYLGDTELQLRDYQVLVAKDGGNNLFLCSHFTRWTG